MADQVNTAIAEGRLPVREGDRGVRSGTTQPIRAQYVLPTLQESLRSLYWVLTFQDCPAYESLRSIGTEQDIAAWSDYLGCGFNAAAEAGRDTPYYSPVQKLVFRLLAAAVGFAGGFVLAVIVWVRDGWRCLRRRTAPGAPWVLALALLGFAALRCGMIAFVEVSSFGIGTSTMYLASVHPLLVLFLFSELWPLLPGLSTPDIREANP